MQVSALTAIFKADFGRFRPVPAVFRPISAVSAPIWPIRPDFGRISPIQRESKPIRHESSRIGANRAESARIREKKKTQTRSDVRATASNAASRVGRGCGTSGAASVFSRYPEAANVFLKQPKPLVLLNNPKKCGHSFLPHPDSTHTHPQL